MKDEEMAEEYCNHLQSEMLAYTPENPRQQRTVTLLDVEEAFLAGYHECQKEHEWYYVKDGDLPKKDGFYEIAFHNIDCDATDICQWLNNEWGHCDGEIKHYINEKIYAWRDKSLPPKDKGD